ncbi:phage virion morphogenesis protein [Acinetobacter baumannii]|uniref:phage virion morphogenesis protein n=1 Tax=Acinetobacter baumannii TaxID=470 RepID=UPI00397CC525
MSFIQIKNDALVSRLGQAADRMGDTTPLSAAIANTFAAITEDNFDTGGRPKWAGLAPDRSQPSYLYQSGNLRRSITTQYTRDQAIIGTNVPYAPILHNGGQTRPHVIRPRKKTGIGIQWQGF